MNSSILNLIFTCQQHTFYILYLLKLPVFVCFQTEQSYKKNPKLLAQLQYCEESGIPWAAILGESELQRGIVKLRNVATREEIEIARNAIVQEMTKLVKAAST